MCGKKRRSKLNEYSLVGINGNAFMIMGYTINAMRDVGFNEKEVESYKTNAMSSDYDHLLYVSLEMVEKCNLRLEEDCY